MKQVWQLSEAKKNLGQGMERAHKNGPQIITRRGVKTVVILSLEEYRQLNRNQKKLSDFFRESPLKGIELDLQRNKN